MGKPTPGVAPTHEDGTPVNMSITPAKVSRFLQAVAGGNYLSTAAAYAGVSAMTIRRWRDRAEVQRVEWEQTHPGQKLHDILTTWLDEHPATHDGKPYAETSPAFNDPAPINMPRGYWLVCVLSVLAEKAEAEAEVQALARVQVAARSANHWQAAMTFLERRHPERWRRPSQLEVSGPGGGPVEVSTVSADQLLGKLEELRAARDQRAIGA